MPPMPSLAPLLALPLPPSSKGAEAAAGAGMAVAAGASEGDPPTAPSPPKLPDAPKPLNAPPDDPPTTGGSALKDEAKGLLEEGKGLLASSLNAEGCGGK